MICLSRLKFITLRPKIKIRGMKHLIAYLQQKISVTLILMALPIWCSAQEWSGMERGECMPDLSEAEVARRAQLLKNGHRIPPIKDLSGKTE